MNDIAAKSESLEKVTFEDALQELEGIVVSLERGEVSLDDAIAAFERGTQLKSHCQARLEEARMKVEKIKAPDAGSAPDGVSNFDMGESWSNEAMIGFQEHQIENKFDIFDVKFRCTAALRSKGWPRDTGTQGH